MDSLASLALATEPPSKELLERLPHRRDDYIISKVFNIKKILIISINNSFFYLRKCSKIS